MKAVEWLGVQNQVRSLLKSGADGKRITLISSMGGTTPPKSGSNKATEIRVKASVGLRLALRVLNVFRVSQYLNIS